MDMAHVRLANIDGSRTGEVDAAQMAEKAVEINWHKAGLTGARKRFTKVDKSSNKIRRWAEAGGTVEPPRGA